MSANSKQAAPLNNRRTPPKLQVCSHVVKQVKGLATIRQNKSGSYWEFNRWRNTRDGSFVSYHGLSETSQTAFTVGFRPEIPRFLFCREQHPTAKTANSNIPNDAADAAPGCIHKETLVRVFMI